MKEEKSLKVYSIYFIIIAVVDFFMAAWDIIKNVTDSEYLADLGNGSVSTGKGMVIFCIAVFVFIALIKIYLGLKGLNEAKGKKQKGFYIVVARVVLVMETIVAVSNIISVFTDLSDNWYTITTGVVTVLVIFFYIKSAKALRKKRR